MKVAIKLKKYNPETMSKPEWRSFEVEAVETDRILDLLNKIKWYQDGTTTFRRSCGHGMCGSCAMLINGENKLACLSLVREYKPGKTIVIEPLPVADAHIQKDLCVDLEPFFRKYRKVLPYLINDEPPPEHMERLQSPADQELIEESTKCILCGSCTYSCPSSWSDPDYLGPSAMLKAFRFIFDTRDAAADERLAILDNKEGVYKCYTVFNCVHACPKEINLTWHIGEIKKRLAKEKY